MMNRSLTAPLPAVRDDPSAEIALLAARYRRANGPVISLMNRLGGRVEDRLGALPPEVRARIERVTRLALERGYHLAASGRHAPDFGPRGPMALAALTGAAGGAGGLATSIAELPVTIAVILHAIRRAAAEEGFDPDDPAIRLEALRVFAAGSPLAADDGVNTAFLGVRMAVTGPALQRILASVAPRLAAALGQKLMAQAVPVLGAVAGAGLNAAFLGYYREVAHVRFGLLRLSEGHGAERVIAAFGKAVQPARIMRNRSQG
jgi:hypothetical protein